MKTLGIDIHVLKDQLDALMRLVDDCEKRDREALSGVEALFSDLICSIESDGAVILSLVVSDKIKRYPSIMI